MKKIKKIIILSFFQFVFTAFITQADELQLTQLNSSEPQVLSIQAPQFKEPKSGITIEKEFTVNLNYTPKADCIAVERDSATLYISKKLLENLAEKAKKITTWKTEQERMNLIYGDRAAILLKKELKTKNKFDCNNTKDTNENEVIYLLSSLLKTGQIAVVDNRKKDELKKQVKVTYSGHEGVFGHISYYANGTPVIGMLSWWIR